MAHQLGTIQRKLSSLIEDFKRARDSWEEINSHTLTTANALTNAVLQSKYVDESQYWHPLLLMDFPNIIQKYDAKMNLIITKHHSKLEDLTSKLEKQYNKMQIQLNELLALYQSTKKTFGDDYIKQQPIYLTCPLLTYVNHMQSIVNMYQQELKTKQAISLQGLRSIDSREKGMVLLSVWINQPSLDKTALQDWQDLCTTEMNPSLS
ncbi:hypothetical protein K501DRAFT_296443 [Backusella circina FSU 941]|nr:hypothetical protein K501DRAFT_296443 [Backusella circina FSU 941]